MGLEDIVDMICADMQHETDLAAELYEQRSLVASYRDGVAEGLHRALVYLELLIRENNNKKAAMPASTAVDPLEEDISYNHSISSPTDFVKEVAEDGK